ncbi:YqzE family protein [Paenibacillus beijingensis]|uniref:YqzE family protein n=1 Tax=Paenibacillus beijingensis TaxID=1126833 RepID=A0A0D5NQC1_9BACL|nr:YqzE family protein [Paenibacillus beijingensis]AJY77375.1 hypothetical protein VN24_25975 [Paenibacillus beijingensis]
MAESEDWIKYMTGRFVTYVDTPRDIRRETKKAAKAVQEPWLTRWFGMGPMGMMLWMRGIWRDRR